MTARQLTRHQSLSWMSRARYVDALLFCNRFPWASCSLLTVCQSLIQRSYRDDVPPSYIERFLPLILDMEEDNIAVTPCFTDEGINYMHIRHNNLYRE